MKRSKTLMGGALALLAFGAAVSTTREVSAQRTLSFATLAPAGSPFVRVLEALNREVRRRTNNQLSIRWYFGGVQGDEAEVVRKIRIGRLDGGALTATGLGHMHRPTIAFQLPAMFQSPEEFVRAYTTLRPELEAGFDRAGFALLHLSPSHGARMFSLRPIRTPEDLRGSRPWRWPDDVILPALYAETGATGVPLAIPEVLGALQTNRIDVVFAPPVAAIGLQWSAHVRFMSERPASGSLNGLALSRTAFTTLPPEQQTILREVIAQAVQLFGRNGANIDADAQRTLVARGVQVVALTEPERQRWLTVFSGVRTRLTGVVGDAAWMQRVQAAGRAPGG